jgi:hypothetical protein
MENREWMVRRSAFCRWQQWKNQIYIKAMKREFCAVFFSSTLSKPDSTRRFVFKIHKLLRNGGKLFAKLKCLHNRSAKLHLAKIATKFFFSYIFCGTFLVNRIKFN